MPKTGDHAQLMNALQTVFVREATEDNLKKALNYCMVKVGLRAEHFPANDEKKLLFSHIRQEYGGHCLAEIRLAWDMALAGKLTLKVDQITCYQDFSCEYFSRIMNAYRRWAAEEVKQLEVKPALPPPTEETGDHAMEDWWRDVVNKVKAGGYAVEFIPIMLYEWMDKKGRIKVGGKEKHHYLGLAAERKLDMLKGKYEEELNSATRQALVQFAEMIEEGEFTGPVVKELKQLAKRMILFNMALNEGK